MTETDIQQHDIDPQETQEWLDALDAVLEAESPQRAHYLLETLVEKARRTGVYLPFSANTAYLNTIPPQLEERCPGDVAMERKIRSYVRWNAMAMVVRANRKSGELGGHISTFASAATLYDVGFNHFWHAPNENHPGDLIYFQGHASPGIYARSFLEGRFNEQQLDNFRQDTSGNGLTSYPHPWLMPDYWQFPTVSMGLGPISSIYQARFLKYIHDRGIADTSQQKVWCFIGDGETDEPETLGAISLAAREKLDNLIFVVNCNLQRLDGPVRGNFKIIQELEAVFRGTGWEVIKVIWGSYWDPLIAKDHEHRLLKIMEDTVDGEYQNYKANGGQYTREHFFGKDPKVKEMVATLSDHDIWRLNRGGHDPHKVYAAYARAVKTEGKPVVILAKTVKGYGLGEKAESRNPTHQQKKLGTETLMHMRERFHLQIPDTDVEQANYYKPADDSPEMQYMHERRRALGGYLPQRRNNAAALKIPDLSIFDAILKGSGDRDMSTTMGFVRILTALSRDKNIGQHIVPIVPDEARTFGMEGMFRQMGIYSSVGQRYEPVDKDQVMYYKEAKSGQIIEEGINEAGAMSSFIAAGTAYSTLGINMIPFYIYYSMFGFQRVGDLAWLAGDIQAKGFLVGGTAGRTTLNGEGLQHQDGHSLVMASTIPNCVAYDPTYAYEMAVIIHNGLKRMYEKQENVFYYITAMNENYEMPAMPKEVEAGIIKGMYLLQEGSKKNKLHAQLLGSGAILREVIAAAELLEKDFSVSCDIWSVTSFNELRREASDVERYNMLHPEEQPRQSYVAKCMQDSKGPAVAATDYIRTYAEQIRPYINQRYTVLGTDGFGRSDTRIKLREFFEVNRYYIAVATLKALADNGEIEAAKVKEAIKRYGIDSNKPNPLIA
ncbi:MAG: pyruvate dehydrogenase (acetyl-transferring), homodimeric type [Gammaproteobacteria bacterium]|nr:pyruvate dehydrogenase (acetyl-transferring), homodimeric type [Gammaproteobacteria bacterium]